MAMRRGAERGGNFVQILCRFTYQNDGLLGVLLALLSRPLRVGGFGTGFLIAPRSVLTCYHVLPDAETAKKDIKARLLRFIVRGSYRAGDKLAALNVKPH